MHNCENRYQKQNEPVLSCTYRFVHDLCIFYILFADRKSHLFTNILHNHKSSLTPGLFFALEH